MILNVEKYVQKYHFVIFLNVAKLYLLRCRYYKSKLTVKSKISTLSAKFFQRFINNHKGIKSTRLTVIKILMTEK